MACIYKSRLVPIVSMLLVQTIEDKRKLKTKKKSLKRMAKKRN